MAVTTAKIESEEIKPVKTKDNLPVFTLPETGESDIVVPAQGEFFIRIKSNITTGYSWELAQPLDKNRVKFIGKVDEDEEGEEDAQGRKLLGAPGFETLKFQAGEPGKGAILLKLVRPWEKGVEPIKKHKINIAVE